MSMPLPATTLAIILGASDYPKARTVFGPSPAFSRSAESFREYLLSDKMFGLPEQNLFYRFDSEDSVSDLDEELGNFLRDSIGAADAEITDVLVYYVGHGGFSSGGQDYYLALRGTRIDNDLLTSYSMRSLAKTLKEYARNVRRYLILDSCFSAAAYKEFMSSGPLAVAERKVTELLPPEQGTALLCASGSRNPAMAPAGAEHTMFSGALLKILRTGDISGNPHFSFMRISEMTEAAIRDEHENAAVRPEIHFPDQSRGSIGNLPFFPNLHGLETEANHYFRSAVRDGSLAKPNHRAPYHPIIFVPGFASTHGGLDHTGMNSGALAGNQGSRDGELRRDYFESPLVRLKDEPIWKTTSHGDAVLTSDRYVEVHTRGEDLSAPNPRDRRKPLRNDIGLPYQSIVVLRFDDEITDGGESTVPPLERCAQALNDLISRIRTLVCRKASKNPFKFDETIDNGIDEADFRVHLVAHSMGGIICRIFLQNPRIGDPVNKSAVDKLFTYATPHSGIDPRVARNVAAWSIYGDISNLKRERMGTYLNLTRSASLSEISRFPADRVFNMVGTNPADYLIAQGLSSKTVGDASDGLVRIDCATTFGISEGRRTESPRAFAHRSHAGEYGLVNSEEGFQNLTRFLFGTLRVDGYLDVFDITLPDEVQAAYVHANDSVSASYRFEVVVALRGSQWQLHRRVVRENSAIRRTYDELFPKGTDGKRAPDAAFSPHLFSVFLDPVKSQFRHQSVAFAFDVAILVPDYQIDSVPWLKRHFEGSCLYRRLIIVEVMKDHQAPTGWRIEYGFQNETPNVAAILACTILDGDILKFAIPVDSPFGTRPGVSGQLRIEVRNWQ